MQVFTQLLKQLTFFLPARKQPEYSDGSGWMGKLASAEGQIDWKQADNEHWAPMKPGDAFYPRDAVRARHDSQAVLLFICPGYGKYLANLYADTTITFMPSVLRKYFANRHSVKDDLDVIGIDPAALAITPNESRTEERK